MTLSTQMTTNLSPMYIQEITSAFEIFNEKKTGYISPNAFKLLLRSLGIRVSRNTVYSHIIEERKKKKMMRKGHGNHHHDPDEDDVDLEMCFSIIERYYPKEDSDLIRESKVNFRLFAGNKGYITREDLERVIQEVREVQKQQQDWNDLVGSNQDPFDFNSEKIKDMVEEFDTNCDGVISYDEFMKIMNYNLPGDR